MRNSGVLRTCVDFSDAPISQCSDPYDQHSVDSFCPGSAAAGRVGVLLVGSGQREEGEGVDEGEFEKKSYYQSEVVANES